MLPYFLPLGDLKFWVIYLSMSFENNARFVICVNFVIKPDKGRISQHAVDTMQQEVTSLRLQFGKQQQENVLLEQKCDVSQRKVFCFEFHTWYRLILFVLWSSS